MFSLFGYALTALALIWGGWTDYKTRTVSNAVWIAVVAAGLFIDIPLMERIVSVLVVIGICCFFTIIMKQKSGGADIKIYIALSFNCGLLICSGTLLIASVLAVVVQLFNKGGGDHRIPAYSYIAGAYLLLLFLLKIL